MGRAYVRVGRVINSICLDSGQVLFAVIILAVICYSLLGLHHIEVNFCRRFLFLSIT